MRRISLHSYPAIVTLTFAATLAACAERGGGRAKGADDTGAEGDGSNEGADDAGGGDGTGGTDNAGADGTASCDVIATLLSPVPDSVDHLYLAPVEVGISTPDPTTTVDLRPPSGVALRGRTVQSEDGLTLTFTPDEPLEPLTTYTVEMTACGGTPVGSAAFSTSGLGRPLTVDVTDAMYVIDLSEANFIETAGLGELLLGSGDFATLLGIDAITSSSIDLSWGADEGGSGRQDFCTPTSDLGRGTFTDPAFEIFPTDVEVYVTGFRLVLRDFAMLGLFTGDGEEIAGGQIEAILDARDMGRDLSGLFGTDSPSEICDLLVGFGTSCEACDSDGRALCVPLRIDEVMGQRVRGSLECVDELVHQASSGDPELRHQVWIADLPPVRLSVHRIVVGDVVHHPHP